MKTVIVHDFLFQYGGAEKVVEKWLEMYPDAIIYTSFCIPEKFQSSTTFSKAFDENRIITSFAQRIFDIKNQNGGSKFIRFQKHFFWLYPLSMRSIKIKNAGLVLISSTDCAKQVRLQNCNKVIHYCHSPTRYLNGLTTDTEHATLSLAYKLLLPLFTWWLKILDHDAVKYLNNQNTIWVANSKYIQKTIKNVYHTRSEVIYPPIELNKFLDNPRLKNKKEFYLCHGRISFHKRLDLAIETCLKLGKKLKISGTSALDKQTEDLKKIVSDYNTTHPESVGLIEFLGRTSDEEVLELMSECKAFLFPGKEDFGIAPIEMLAAGVPIIAYEDGGALEYVQNGINGVFFDEQSIKSMVKAIENFEASFIENTQNIRKTTLPFDESKFRNSINDVVAQKMT
ncbi:MAG: glycosyltransferase [candidate division SR1 bacterium]|nr:glycosyltransferase [candidate division SR1 bacterium]